MLSLNFLPFGGGLRVIHPTQDIVSALISGQSHSFRQGTMLSL